MAKKEKVETAVQDAPSKYKPSISIPSDYGDLFKGAAVGDKVSVSISGKICSTSDYGSGLSVSIEVSDVKKNVVSKRVM